MRPSSWLLPGGIDECVYSVYANQGYVLFAPNWTGSVSFGQSFTDAIAGDWGGAPFEDMRAGWTEFIKQHPEVDTERTAGWGASWGGYGVKYAHVATCACCLNLLACFTVGSPAIPSTDSHSRRW